MTRSSDSPRFVYDRRYVEPEIQLLVAEPAVDMEPGTVPLLSRVFRYKPTGTRTKAGLYEYELIEESALA